MQLSAPRAGNGLFETPQLISNDNLYLSQAPEEINSVPGKVINYDSSPADQFLSRSMSVLQNDSDLNNLVRVEKQTYSAACVDGELVCPITPEEIQNRWLASYVPDPDQPVKEYSTFIIQFISRILRSYIAVSINGDSPPPFVHLSQSMSGAGSSHLLTCLNLVRICAEHPQGCVKTTIDIIGREMEIIHRTHAGCDQTTVLAIFQAYLIYSMTLHFWFNDSSTHILRQAIINLQELACASVRQGIMCVAEQQSQRPSWEAWIAAESKRRTLYTMYMFDSILSARDGLPSHLATELHGLPAPSTRRLWQADTQSQWQAVYDAHLARLPSPELQINELWPCPAGLDESERVERRRRVDEWLGGIDEFGTMLFTVTSLTHGS